MNYDQRGGKSRLLLFFENTSFHIFGDIHKSKTKLLKVFWIVLLVFCIFMLFTSITCQIRSYIKAEVKVSVIWQFNSSMPTPVVSICYLGGLNKTKMMNHNSPNWLATLRQTNASPSNYTVYNNLLKEDINRMNMSGYHEYLDYYSIDQDQMIDANSIQPRAQCGVHPMNIPTAYYHVEYLSCYKLCFEDQTFSGATAGPRFELISPINGNESEGHFSLEFIDPAYSLEFNNYLLPLGFKVHIMLQKTEHIRVKQLQPPKTGERCVDAMKKPYRMNCAYDCWINETEKTCNCSMIFGRHDSVEKIRNQSCTVFDVNHCPIDHESRKKCQKGCLPDCETVQFIATTSMIPNTDPTRTTVNIGYPRLVKEVVTESDAYPITDLVSNIGGQFGLWLGCSLASLIQAVMLCTTGYGKSAKR